MRFNRFLFISVFFSLVACQGSGEHDDDNNQFVFNNEDVSYQWEKDRKQLLGCNNLVLLYGGGSHRAHLWDSEYITPYVTYVDENKKEHWLFDGFLFLEIHNGIDKEFTAGMKRNPANKQDWKGLADYYFQSETALGALDNAIASAITRIGIPSTKRRVVIAIPEPIYGQTDWGGLGSKAMLNFSDDNDRIAACEWYINYVRAKFNHMKYKYIELSGFYWIAEQSKGTKTILSKLATYLNLLKYTFNWIPYFNASGYSEWKSYGFNYAYYQPNYFFNEKVPISRLEAACNAAKTYDLGLEMEFDERLFTGFAYRLSDYMSAFKKYGVWDSKRIAYYQGGYTFYNLSKSDKPAYVKLYNELCHFIIDRPLY